MCVFSISARWYPLHQGPRAAMNGQLIVIESLERNLSQFRRAYLLAASAVMVVGATAHLAVIGIGPRGYAALGAPAGLVAMVGTASYRPAATCVAIALLLLLGAAYGFSSVGFGPQLPGRRYVLPLVGAGLIARAVLLPVAAFLQPALLLGICGKCQVVNDFVLFTSALCLFVGAAYAAGGSLQRSA